MTAPDPQPNSKMEQKNQDQAKGWQTEVKGGTVHIADRITQNYYNDRLRQTGVPFQVPPLPRPYVDRPIPRQAVKTKLLATEDTTPGTLVVSAIYGLGGIGKSVLATVLAHDPEVQARFPNGILWATLGQQPDVLAFLSSWMQALGDYDYKPTTIDAASMHLRTLLYDKQTLIVVDDLWHPDHMEPFRVGGSGCRVLVTTREARIPDSDRYDMDVMTAEEALGLLLQKAQCPEVSGDDRQQAEALAKEVGYLPLALELAGAQVAEGVLWAELLEDLRAEIVRLEALDAPNADQSSSEKNRKRLSLLASFNLSLRQLSPEQLRHFAWLGVLPEDVMVTQDMAATLWAITPRQAGAILRALWSKALMLPGVKQADQKATYRLHDLMHDLAKGLLTKPTTAAVHPEEFPGLGLTIPAAHGELLARYRAKTQQGQWHTLPDDGYIHAHLTWHLEKAEQPDILHQLLQETTPEGRNGWYEACERLGQTANFVTDVARAWQVAEQQYEQNPSGAIALQLRYALITTTLNSLAKNIPVELMAALVKHGLWTPAQGLAYAQQAQKSRKRAEILRALARYLPSTLLEIALKVARDMQDEECRAWALRGLATYLPAALLPEALAIARDIQSYTYHAFALSGLVPYLPEVIPEALTLARNIQFEDSRALELMRLAPYLPEVIPEALTLARNIQSDIYRDRVLSGLAQYLPTALLPEALTLARNIQNEHSRVKALSDLAQYLPAALLPEALVIARNIQNESNRVWALSTLATYLPEVIPEALAVARGIQEKDSRVEALSGLATYLPEVIPEALAIARGIQDEDSRAKALMGLAVTCLPEVIPEAWAIARNIQNDSSRAWALNGFARYLPAALLPEALAAACDIQNEYFRTFALSGLAQYLPAALLPEAWAVARVIQDENSRAEALRGLATYLPEVIPEALAVARGIQEKDSRVEALKGLATYLPEVIPEALAIARGIHDEYSRVKALSGLATYLPEVIPEALAIARGIQNEYSCANALRSLAPYLPTASLSEALAVARDIQDEHSRAEALGDLAPHLPAALLPEAWAVARDIQNDSHRANALKGLAPYLPAALLPEAWAVARDIQFEPSRAWALRELAPYLPAALLPEALTVACDIQDESDRAEALIGFLPQIDWESIKFDFWGEILHTLSRLDRSNLIEAIPQLAPGILALGGKAALAAVVVALREVCEQWR
jgi:hypothetical protein